jgi:fatty-acid desaturase
LSSEILSDPESRKDRIRRQMQIGGVLTAILAVQTSIGMTQLFQRLAAHSSQSIGAPVLTIALAGAFTVLGVWCLWQMEQARKREE